MDYCWHCPICDITLALDEMSAEQLAELKAEAATGESAFSHDLDGGDSHPLSLISVRH